MTPGRLIVLVVIALQAFSPYAYAAGVGSAPDSLTFSLTRDGSETKTLVLLAESGARSTLSIVVTGEIGGWVDVTPFGSTTPTGVLEVGADGRALADVTISVPIDAANGTYTADIEIYLEDSNASIRAGVVVPVTVEVTGSAIVAGSLTSIATPSVASPGGEIIVTASVLNTGSVLARPTMVIALSDNGGVLGTNSTEFAPLAPGESADVSARVPARGSEGDRLAIEVVVLLDSIEIGRTTATIDVVPAVATTKITPLGIVIREPADTGGVTRLAGTFRNDGTEAVIVAFVGSVFLDGASTDSIESISVRAEPGQTASAELFVPIRSEGDYEITGRWEGDGFASEPVTFSWRVGLGLSLVPILGASIFAVLALVLVGASVRYWRQTLREDEVVPSIKVGSGSR